MGIPELVHSGFLLSPPCNSAQVPPQQHQHDTGPAASQHLLPPAFAQFVPGSLLLGRRGEGKGETVMLKGRVSHKH